ncbi:hypothetical protein DFP74_0561 [Nocardiopsis sp. Huas11]|nr:hypothetical protein DFP74_0561 [Nocardiopsis sp. Huas11]
MPGGVRKRSFEGRPTFGAIDTHPAQGTSTRISDKTARKRRRLGQWLHTARGVIPHLSQQEEDL